ncbi:MAG: S-layer homology domain-containing protein [Chloroflexi bacterium]|nr:S-layer homology domain-containing protein [Chloroflexota bacterium]
MKNKGLRHPIFLNLIMAAILLTSVNASHMTMVAGNLLHRSRSNAPTIGNCPIFPQNNYWNMPVDNLPLHSLSSAWITTIGPTTGFHMDFGSGTWDGGPIGIPFNIVSGAQTTKYTVDFYYPGESDPGPYPIPQNPKIEYGSDHHILTVDTDDCKLYEIYDAQQVNGQWSAGSGAIWDLNSNALRPDGWTSADAAGLPILAGLARYDEVAAGKIDHALRFTTNCTADYYIWPARHVAQHGSCTTTRVPFGARFRLKASYDITNFSPHAQIILQAMKTYGIVLADNGSPWYVSGEPNESWDNDVLHELDVVTGNNFEAVDTSQLTPWIFSDVPDSHWAWQFIERLYNAGITGGCATLPTLRYCPVTSVTRAQMAIFLLRGIHGRNYIPPAATGTIFNDVPASSFAAAWIERLSAEGITSGCGNGSYCPNAPVTRSQMAVFLLRGEHGSSYTPPPVTVTRFSDVPGSYPTAAWIEQLAAENISSGCGGANFCPASAVTRDQMAVFLVRTFNLP